MSANVQDLPTMAMKSVSSNPDWAHDKRKEGWKLTEDNAPPGTDGNVLRLDGFLKEGESFVKGLIMLERAKEMGTLAGQLQAERLLKEQKEMPKEWRSFRLIFAGTVWRDSRDHMYVPYLNRGIMGWGLHFFDLGLIFDFHCRLVRLSK